MKLWKDLDIRTKANYIRTAVSLGLKSLKDIEDSYEEFNKFAEGEEITDTLYYNTMERVAKENWRRWGDPSEEAALLRILNDNSYNYRGYYNKYPDSSANAETHWNDEFKTVYHPTFSNESIYSPNNPNYVGKTQYNPNEIPGGFWLGETHIPTAALLLDRNRRIYSQGGNLFPIGGGLSGVNTMSLLSPEVIRLRLYDNIDPTMDYKYSIPAVGLALSNIDTHGMFPQETDMSNITGNPAINLEIWGKYLQRDLPYKYVKPATYKPIGEENTELYKVDIPDTGIASLVKAAVRLPLHGQYYDSNVLGGYGMNNHSIAKAVDPNRGEYVVYKDIYDLNPFHGSRSIAEIPGLSSIDDLSMGIGKPVHLYDRIYLDDYYGVDNKPDANTYWGKWLPEVTVKGKKHSKGGNLFDGMTMPSLLMNALSYPRGTLIYEHKDPIMGSIRYSTNDIYGNEIPLYVEDNTDEDKRNWIFRDSDGNIFNRHLDNALDISMKDKPLESVYPEAIGLGLSRAVANGAVQGTYNLVKPILEHLPILNIFAAEVAHRQGFTDDGWRKTARLIKEGNYGDAALSGADDILALTMMTPTAYRGSKYAYDLTKQGLNWAKYMATGLSILPAVSTLNKNKLYDNRRD